MGLTHLFEFWSVTFSTIVLLYRKYGPLCKQNALLKCTLSSPHHSRIIFLTYRNPKNTAHTHDGWILIVSNLSKQQTTLKNSLTVLLLFLLIQTVFRPMEKAFLTLMAYHCSNMDVWHWLRALLKESINDIPTDVGLESTTPKYWSCTCPSSFGVTLNLDFGFTSLWKFIIFYFFLQNRKNGNREFSTSKGQ